MPGRGPQTFKKRQKEQERKERQQEKMAKRLQRKAERPEGSDPYVIEPFEDYLDNPNESAPPNTPGGVGHNGQ